MVSSAEGFGVVRGDTGGSRASVGPRPRGSGGDTRFRCLGEDRPAVGICTFSSAPTGGGFVDRTRWLPPTVDGRSRQISVWRSTSPATGASSRQELGRGRMCRSPVAAYQLRPTGVLSRCVRPRIAGNPCTDRWTPSRTSVCGGRCREARDLGAVARVRRTSVRGAGSPRRDASSKARRSFHAGAVATSRMHPAPFCCSLFPLFYVDSLRSRLTVDAGSSVLDAEASGFAPGWLRSKREVTLESRCGSLRGWQHSHCSSRQAHLFARKL